MYLPEVRLVLLFTYAISVAIAQQTTSIFVPDEFQSNTFDVSIVNSVHSTHLQFLQNEGLTSAQDATATTFEFYPGCAFGPCGPVTLIQGPGTAIFSEDLGPSLITTVWSCKLSPTDSPTTAECSLTSTATFGCCEGTDTKQYPPGTGFAFPTYKAVVTAGTFAGGGLMTSSTTGGVARPTESVFTASGTSSTTAAVPTIGTTSISENTQNSVVSSSSDSTSSVTMTGAESTRMAPSSTSSAAAAMFEHVPASGLLGRIANGALILAVGMAV